MRRLLLFSAIVLLLVVAWFFRSEVGRVIPNPPSAAPLASPEESSGKDSSSSLPRSVGRSTLADPLNSPAYDIWADLRLVSDVLDTFRSNFPRLGNPTGSNAEITAVLTGKNPLQLSLIPRDHPAINAQGELCDRWGRPFFFHQASGTQMEIHSAGPDKKMWTEDDARFTP